MILKLLSVGSCIDIETHMVYPLSNTGEPCLDVDGIHIMDVSDELLNGLDEDDFYSILGLVYSDNESIN